MKRSKVAGTVQNFSGSTRTVGGVRDQLGEDARQEAALRLLTPKVAAKYDPAKGSKAQFESGVRGKVRREVAGKDRKARELRPTYRPWESAAPDPSEEAIRNEIRDRVRAAVAQLPWEESSVVVRRFLLLIAEGDPAPLSSTERSQLRRALIKLRGLLENLL